MLKALSRFVGRSSQPSLEQVMPVVNDLATRDVVLNNLSANPVLNAQFASNNLQLWEELGKQYFPESERPSHQDPISFFQSQQNVLDLSLLTSEPTDEILAKKQFTVALLLRSFAQRNPNLPLDQFLRNVSLTESTANLEKEALQVAVSATLEFDRERVHPHHDLTAVLSTYLEQEEQVKVMMSQLLSQIGQKVQEWALKMSALLNYFSVAQILVTCDAQLVRKVTGQVIADVAFRGHARMVELLYPHICDCVHEASANPDADIRYCVLEKAAKAKQKDVIGCLLTVHGPDFPEEKRLRLLQAMSAQNETEIVEFLLTNFRESFSAWQILSLRGQPGFQGARVSYSQLFMAPLLERARRAFGVGEQGASPAMSLPAPTTTLAIEGPTTALPATPFLAIEGTPSQIKEKKNDEGENSKGQRKRLALEGRPSEVTEVLPLSLTYTPAAAAASSVAAAASSTSINTQSHTVEPMPIVQAERALVPVSKKRGAGGK